MASILFESPIPYEGIAESRRKEQALGAQIASNLMNTYFRAQQMRAQQEQWAEEKPIREAQAATWTARAATEKAQAEIAGIEAINVARRNESMAGLAALQEEAATKGWDTESEGKFRNFISLHPEFYGSKEASYVDALFQNARRARADEEKWRTEEATKLTVERMRQDAKANGVAYSPSVWADPVTGKRFAISEGGALVSLKDDKVGTAQDILNDKGEKVPGIVNIDGKVVRLPDGVGALFNTGAPQPVTTNAPAGKMTIRYDSNGKRIQ